MHLLAQHLGQIGPAVPVALVHAVFNGDDGVAVDPVGQLVGEFVGGEGLALGFQHVLAALVELGAGAVQGNVDVLARGIAGIANGFHDHFQGRFVGGQIGGEAAFIADRRIHALLLEHRFQGMEHFRAPAQRLAEAGRADRHDHEFLHVHAVVGMGAAVQDVHHRHRQMIGAGGIQVLVQRHALLGGGGMGDRHGHAQQGVGAEAALGGGAVQGDHLLVDGGLIVDRFHADQGATQFAVDVSDRFQHALAQIAALVAVAQLQRLAAAGGGARRHRRAALGAGGQDDVHLHCRITAGIQNLTALNRFNCRHR